MADLHKNGTPIELEFETREWLDSLRYVLQSSGPDRVVELIQQLETYAQKSGVEVPLEIETPYVNTIPVESQANFPGDRALERRIKSLVRWNAMAMVVRANRIEGSLGGHISTYASSATLFEIGFNHFFHGRTEDHEGDLIFFQGHASPGVYARAFLEGRLSEIHLENFRRELAEGGGLSSYPHPWLMPDFWQFPTVSMGLGPIMAIYQARFAKYLENRGLKKPGNKVWAFIGDGETGEPETMGALHMATRDNLDNLIFVINCNLQRLDGPVHGNGKIVQELEGIFRGAGWNVIKVVWGSAWDDLFARDTEGLLVQRLNELVDGEFQKYSAEDGAYIREHLFGTDPRLLKLVEHLSDEDLERLNTNRGGHDPLKVYAAYKAAVEHKGRPTVILAKTIKGYGLGESGEGRNAAHNQKKLKDEAVRYVRDRFEIPIPDDLVDEVPFFKPGDDSPEIAYMHERRQALGDYIPRRVVTAPPVPTPDESLFEEFYEGSSREASTTMVFVRVLSKLLRDKTIGDLIVPIVPDESRTFGMESLFRQVGIYAPEGQLYEPVDKSQLMYYKEAKDGQFMQEGISEAGSMSTFIAAGTAYANYGVNSIPFFTYYSMFGFQRIGDLVWAAGDSRCRGFLIGGTSGRTSLNGEGLQHQDGHSHVLASTFPTMRAYDPAFAFEIAVIIRYGLYHMYELQEDVFYYLTVHNDNYIQLPMPEGDREKIKDGIIKGLYKFQPSQKKDAKMHVHLFGSGAIMNSVLDAQRILEERYDISADVWSVTSYTELRRDALLTERWNLLHPGEAPRKSHLEQCFEDEKPGVFVASSDYMKIMPDGIRQWIPGRFIALGTDGFGRSETRENLRDHFEVDGRYVTLAALTALAQDGHLNMDDVEEGLNDLQINPEKPNPMLV